MKIEVTKINFVIHYEYSIPEGRGLFIKRLETMELDLVYCQTDIEVIVRALVWIKHPTHVVVPPEIHGKIATVRTNLMDPSSQNMNHETHSFKLKVVLLTLMLWPGNVRDSGFTSTAKF